MNPLRTAAVGVVSTLAFGTFALTAAPAANAGDTASEPCASQQAQVDRATAKLAALTEKFAAQPTKKNQKAKKAQVQRLAHATARLDACLAAQPS
jgi:hypothetical protein